MKNQNIIIVGFLLLIQLVFTQCHTSKNVLFSPVTTYYSDIKNHSLSQVFTITSDTFCLYVEEPNFPYIKNYDRMAKCKITHQEGDFYEINSIDVAWMDAIRAIQVEYDTIGKPTPYVSFVFRFPKFQNGLRVLIDEFKPVIDGEVTFEVERSKVSNESWFLVPDECIDYYNFAGQYFGIVRMLGSIDFSLSSSNEPSDIQEIVNRIIITYPTLCQQTFSEYYLTGQYIKITPNSIFWNGEEYHAIDKKRLAGCKFISPNDTIQF